MTLSAVLTALGLAPKNLDEARGAHAQAKATLDAVAALFAAAGLNLEQMLAAGPEALKAHLESLSGADEALAEALLENENLDNQLATLRTQHETALAERAALLTGLQALGLAAPTAEQPLTEAAVKAALDQAATQRATLLLAQTGHPAVSQVVDGQSAQKAPAVTGRARVVAAFAAQKKAKA